MAQLIGIRSYEEQLHSELKRDLLLFDRIGVIEYKSAFTTLRTIKESLKEHFDEIVEKGFLGDFVDKVNDLEYLESKDLIFETPEHDFAPLILDEDSRWYFEKSIRLTKKLMDNFDKNNALCDTNNLFSDVRREYEKDHTVEILPLSTAQNFTVEDYLRMTRDLLIRAESLRFQKVSPETVVPIVSGPISFVRRSETATEKKEIVRVVLKFIPTPAENVPWEQIFDFRADPDSKSKFLALRNWMTETARAKLSPNEIEEKLEYLVDQYQKHLSFHKIKYRKSNLETFIITSLELVEDIVKFRFSHSAKRLFSLKYQKIDLAEAELKAPGNEIAYITKVEDEF
jgi:hypothetical protein